ncbi:MAG TPA: MG2 domain-containing protein, partial [Pirellulales bacterium]|nr:MG2 domain-containing protein [Pirellulales bacterium]
REAVIRAHLRNWRLLWRAAETYLSYDNYGFLVAGKFYRGQHRGGGQAVNSFERDRVRALQLMVQAMHLAAADSVKNDIAGFYFDFARLLLGNRGYDEAWRLQNLTDLSQLPDFVEGWYYGHTPEGAPVGVDGNPIFYRVPKSFDKAVSDGELWRWALEQATELAPSRKNESRWQLADFLQNQFGVQTMAYYGRFFARQDEADDSKKNGSGTYALQTLADGETIARLAIGIKRFKLPAEFDFINIFEQIAAEPQSGYGAQALEQLSQIYENRRQYPKAADYWRRAIKQYGPGDRNYRQQRLDQIVGNWGRFEPIMSQPAGKGATVEFRYRNGSKVSFEAHEIKVAELLADVKAYLKTRPNQLDWQKTNIGDVGYRLVTENQQQYLGAKVADWDLELKPLADHFDRRVTVSTPLQKAGAYLLTAKMADGNTSHIIIWLEDTVIVKKPLDKGMFYFVADAITGEPIPKANLEFFGFRQAQVRDKNQFNLEISSFAEFTDANGEFIGHPKQDDNQFQWMVTATTPSGRFAYLGYTSVWYPTYFDAEYNETRVFSITDRPVYRPEQKVKFKFWIRHAKYDEPDVSDFANQHFTVEIHDPLGQKALSKVFTTDAYGGLEGEFPLPADAKLGTYQLSVVNFSAGGSFRVEEYKKPEYEVTVDAPTEPVMLGEKITAKVKAKYYFGSPVTKAKVHYKVLRTNYSQQWYPTGEWDWLYGPGYWWFSYDDPWYPGWLDWGCRRPIPWWWNQGQDPPEVVADRQVDIGADGAVPVEIDTAVAKLIHPDEDHQYEITAEVVDESRRTIVGVGKVLVARKPFKVFAWVDRGYYRVDDVVRGDFFAQTVDGKPVQGEGKLKLLKISYKDNKPVEASVREWDLPTDAAGQAKMQVKASEPGQYRLSYNVTDAKKHSIEGGYLFTIMGDGFDGADFQFNNLELIADKREYAPGQSVNLMVNTNRSGGTVLLFVRPANGVYLEKETTLHRLKGKSLVQEIAVVQKDMPNFFVEALTISGGKLYSETREIVVPPEKRVLNVAVQPSRNEYKPGQKASIAIKLTDIAGKPFVGSTVVAIYDMAVEYISGGSNVEEIKSFFWKWRRNHTPTTESSLFRSFASLVRPDQAWMQNLGVFGETGVEEAENDRLSMDASGASGLGSRFAESRLAKEAPAGAAFPAPASLSLAAGMAHAPASAEGRADNGAAAPPLVQPTIRTNFADTALWVGSLATNENGEAEVSLDMPENLTTWKVKVWGMGHGTKVGQGEAEVVTRKDLIVRLQGPRFFVEKDEVVLSANVHNYLKTKKKVQVALELPGKELSAETDGVKEIEVPAGEESRVDWRVKVVREGETTIRMKALTDEESDAVEQKFPVYVHGMLKMDSFSGALRPKDESGHITINVPAQRRRSESVLEVRYSPTLAGALIDALPYLVDYPYGCTEQTLNRFLPTVVTQHVLIRMGLDLKKVQQKRTNLNAQEIGDDKARAAGWKRFDRNPVFDSEEVGRMAHDGAQKLTQMQLADGGWGWFSGFGEQSWPHTTAVVVHGLQVAKLNDVALVPGTIERGIEWLKHYQEQQIELLKNALVKPKPKEPYKTAADNLDAFVYMVLVDGGVNNVEMREFLYRDRTQLAVYGKALLGLALEKQNQKEKLAMVLKNIEQFLVEDNENQTAYLKLPEDNWWWAWYGSEIEADAYYLKLLSRTDPKGAVAPKLVKYLLNNRKHASYWNSTRDTALAIEAMAEFLKTSGEDKPDLSVEVWLDGKKQKEVKIASEDLFTFDNKFVLQGDAVTTGKHDIELRKKGSGPLYYNAYLTLFSLEDTIPRAGLEVKVNRKVYKLIRDDKTIQVAGSRGQSVGQQVEKYRREELKDLDTLKSGDLVEVELEIDAKNDYEYLVFEDMKAAGFEPVEVRSGYGGNALGAYMELRDNRVSFFLRTLARGKHSVAYRLRAETPGRFSALPARASAMYAPELKGNSDEIKLQIAD